ncbi:MAG: spore maturation protein [Peptococcaceae bacterium]|nr:spore maturation protein [Peptococcaceae bacterium]
MIILIVCMVIVGAGLLRRVQVFEEFIEGARQGISTVVRLFPYILAMIIAVNLLQASGLLRLIEQSMGVLAEHVGMPKEVVPLAILRPLTGSGSLVVAQGILSTYGPDSFVGMVASAIQGSSDTTLYVITVYFGAIGVKKIRHSLLVGLLSDLVTVGAALLLTHHLYN